MPQTPAPTRANVRQSATWRISDTNLSPPCQLTTHAADSMLFLSKSRLVGFLPTKFPEYPALNSLAALDLQMKTPTQAGPLLLRALKIREEALGPDNPETGTALNNLGSFYASTGDYTKGKDLLERSLQQTQRVLGTNHP